MLITAPKLQPVTFDTASLLLHVKQYPEIAGFLHPVQKLLGVELSSVSNRIATGKQVPTYV